MDSNQPSSPDDTKPKQIVVVVPPELHAAITRLAQKEDRKLSAMVRVLCQRGIDMTEADD